MRRPVHSKSSLFLTELIIDILLFALLCACSLLFFVKSTRLTTDSTDLYQGVRLCSQVASIYESGDGGFSTLEQEFIGLVHESNGCMVYFDKQYQPSSKEDASYYVLVTPGEYSVDCVTIAFYNMENVLKYSISTCNYSPSTLLEVKEDAHE